MNLWDKALRLTLILGLAVFFVACKEELNNVGKNNNIDQFDLLFEEFTLPSHVIIDSLSTGEEELITGKYIDADFGVVSSEAYSSFAGVVAVDLNGSDIVFDSAVISLKLAPYYYGAKVETPVIFRVHRVLEEITQLSNKTNFSSTMYDPISIGETSFKLRPEKYDTLELSETDTLRIKLDELYFDEVKDALTVSGSTTLDISTDSGFHGFAIVSNDADKMVGISGVSAATKLTIHYHTVDGAVNKDTLTYDYSFAQRGYNRITSDRSGTAIADLKDENTNEPFTPSNGMRYVQSGTGITTELDLQPYLDFFNDKDHIAINSVEFSFGNLESTTDFAPPIGLSLFNTDENSQRDPLEASGAIFASVQSDATGQLYIPFVKQEDNFGIYSGLSTQYFQFLYNNKIDRSTAIIRSAVVSNGEVVNSRAGYTVDRFVINQDSIKLKVFYTTPNN